MPAVPLIKYEHLAGPIGYLEDQGLPVEPILRRNRLPCLGLGDPDLFVTSHLLYGFLQSCVDEYDLEEFGSLAAEQVAIREHPWTSTALAGTRTLGDALQSLFRLAREESSHVQLWIQTEGETAFLCHRGSGEFGSAGSGVVEDYMITIPVCFVREAIGLDWTPSCVKVKSPSFSHLFGSRLFHESRVLSEQQVTAVAIPLFLFTHPLEKSATKAAAGRDQGSSQQVVDANFVGSLETALRPYLRDGPPRCPADGRDPRHECAHPATAAGRSWAQLQRSPGEDTEGSCPRTPL